MLSSPEQFEINHHTLKLIVGVIALSLASVTNFLTDEAITSISASYHEGGLARDYFIGSLAAIFSLLLAYNGGSRQQMILSKIAAFSALGVAIFPCKCVCHTERIPGIHGASAAIMFIALAIFCYLFYRKAKVKSSLEAARRSQIYLICGVAIVASVVVLGLDQLLNNAISSIPGLSRLTFFGEMTGLVAFGIAWLTASRALPIITNKNERLNPFG